MAGRAPPAAAHRGHRPRSWPLRAGRRSAATAGACPTSALAPATTPGSGRASATARTGSGSSTSTGAWRAAGWPRSPASRASPRTDSCAPSACAGSRSPRRRPSGEELGSALDAYSAGINAAVEAAAALPVEFQLLRTGFEPWRPADTLTLTKLLALGLSTNWERELIRADMVRELGPELAARLDPGYPEGNPVALEPGAEWRGDGDRARRPRSTSCGRRSGWRPRRRARTTGPFRRAARRPGRPLLAGDPHLPPSMPGITYELGLEVGGRTCRGASFPGRIGIAFGQNDDVAWSFTNTMADVMDLFVERVRRRAVRVSRRAAAARAHRGGDRGQGARRARAARSSAPPITARSSTRPCAPTPTSRWRCAGPRSRRPA